MWTGKLFVAAALLGSAAERTVADKLNRTGMQVREKLQHPRTNIQETSSCQAPKEGGTKDRLVWLLAFFWNLDVGVWNFHLTVISGNALTISSFSPHPARSPWWCRRL